jgi:NAD(P)-dependent dehydrogenase (short-subunit alcohol dehydrogenase family)
MGKLEGKIALVTGGNSGIGLAIAKRFVREGAYVFIAGRRKAELDAAAKEIGSNVTGIQGDVSNLPDLDRLFAQIKRQSGKLDIVFCECRCCPLCCFGRYQRGVFRFDFRHQRKGRGFYGSEGASALAGWRLDHPECVHRWEQRACYV